MLADITLLKQAQDQLQDIAFHDGLTGLPNRLLLIDRLEQALEAARRHQRSLAVCYVDLDGFKRINDEFGHAAGDRLLKEVALRLAHAVRANDTVCRLGGDEFIILLTELGSAASCQELLQRVIEDLERPFDLDGGRQARLSASIGVAIFPGDGEQPETLINNADRAMYDAKKLGLHRVCMFGAPAPIALAAATA